MKRLPPLTAIEAFVQTARLGSVKAAADALALSSPALTRRIQALERHVNRPLFERRHQSIHLNEDGERLLAEVGPVLDELGQALERATGGGAHLRLRLGVLPLFASYRLMPRLPELKQLHPELHLDLDTGAGAVGRLEDGLDAAIILAREPEPGLYAHELGLNRVIAIGASKFAEGPEALADPGQLAGMTALIHRDLPNAFDYWREAAGVPDLHMAETDMFDSGQLLLNAAIQGLGVAFMFEMHLEGAHDERLAQLFGIAAESPYAYWFVCRRAALNRRAVRIFRDWLVGTPG
ncbi:LysR substrate-binding domain-containing protein [Sphingosinicella sp. LHD-64]|uniref:LysR substrate-binding domain-containing protein n=1 Tax=Sphingosinicella sp. LHD-64 TaxID=3072139 RepID=UPI00280EBB2A|nr:LysR substrate-binding domain-containing protein [Sphingosinicella sp. LHD-64]MDQ8755817.1 LysR substrate-binding domain-containing protein [Sphingosinicella sp. LHD-64]